MYVFQAVNQRIHRGFVVADLFRDAMNDRIPSQILVFQVSTQKEQTVIRDSSNRCAYVTTLNHPSCSAVNFR